MTKTLLSFLGWVISARALATCYYPDGITTDPNHVPCNQTSSAVSSCCDPLDACSQSGFCLGRSGWNYRGTCTDRTWGSNNCARKFDSCLTDPFTKKKYSGFTAIWSCASVSGTQGNNWCCATGDSSTSCCNASFGALVTGGAFMPGLDQFILNITQAAQQNSSSTNVNASSLAGGSDNKSALGTKVGLGVGVPLGVLVLGLLTWLFFRERSKNHARRDTSGVGAGPAYSSVGASGNMEQSSSIASPMHANTTAPYYSSYDANNNHSGMQGQQYHSNTPKNNLYGGADSPVYEVPSTNDIHEMRG